MTEIVSQVVRAIDEATRLGRLSNHLGNVVPPGAKRFRPTPAKSTGELQLMRNKKRGNEKILKGFALRLNSNTTIVVESGM